MKCADRSISPTSFVKHKHSINVEAADVKADGEVNIADVTSLIDMLLAPQ